MEFAASRTQILGAIADLDARRTTLYDEMNALEAPEDQGQINAYQAAISLLEKSKRLLVTAADGRVVEHRVDPPR